MPSIHFNFKNEREAIVETDDMHYEIFNGYFNFEKMLVDPEQAAIIRNAIDVIDNFIDQGTLSGNIQVF